MLQVQTEVAQEQLPAVSHRVVLVVPVRARPETAVDQPHDARAAVAGFDHPLEGESIGALSTVEDHSVGWFPSGDPTRCFHPRAE